MFTPKNVSCESSLSGKWHRLKQTLVFPVLPLWVSKPAGAAGLAEEVGSAGLGSRAERHRH